MRIALFNTVEEINAHPDKVQLNNQTFSAIDYATAQILLAGISVVYDAHHNKRSIRVDMEAIAAKYNALPIVVWIKTPRDVAIERGLTREAAPDSRKMTPERMQEVMARHTDNFDEPLAGENVVVIDGTIPFTEQYAAFNEQLATIVKL